MSNYKSIFLLIGWLFASSLTISAQVTSTSNNDKFSEALDLFNKKKYSYAQHAFEALTTIDRSNISVESEYYSALCSFHLQKKDVKTQLKRFINKHPNHQLSNYASLYLGRFYFKNKKHNLVLGILDSIDSRNFTNEENIEINYLLGYTHFFKKDFKKSKSHLTKIFNLPSKYYYPSNYYLGYMAYYDKQLDLALRHFYVAVESKKYKNIAPFYIAQILFIKNEYDKVLEYADKLMQNPKFKYKSETLNVIAQSHFHLKDYENAAYYLEEYIKSGKEVLKSDIYNLGYSHFQLNDFENARINFEKLTDNADSLGQNANYLLAECFLKLNQKEGARSAYQKASLLDFDKNIQETASFNYCKLTYELNYNFDAVEAIQKFLNQFIYSKYQSEAKELLAKILLTTKNYEMAINVIDQIENPTLGVKKALQKVCYYRGVELFNEMYFDLAINHFKRAILNPIDPKITAKAYYWQSEAYSEIDNPNAAIENLMAFKEVAPLTNQLELIEQLPFGYYSLAYAHYNQKEISKARLYFQSSVKEFDALSDSLKNTVAVKKTLPDAKLRLADCHFILKKYSHAQRFYKEVYDNKSRGADYALYQSGLIYGLEAYKNSIKKLELLKRLTDNYKWSMYHDEALFEIGDTYLKDKNKDSSAYYFNKVEELHPGSELGRKALLKLALLYLDNNDLEKAKTQCNILLTNYPKTAEGKEAINVIKNIYINEGTVEDLVILLTERFPTVKFSLEEQDSASYHSAELQYQNKMYAKAEELFEVYRKNFSNGYFILNAHYYSADCAFRAKKYNEAEERYKAVIKLGKSLYLENALANITFIHHKINKNYREAYKSYEMLLTESELKSNKLNAVRGLAFCSNALNKMEKLKLYSNTLLQLPDASPKDQLMAEYYIAKTLLKEKNIDSALVLYEHVKAKSTEEIGVEARFQIADIYYQKDSIDTSINLCFDIIQNLPNYENWLAKTFILLAKNYVKQDNTFQAKATLQSIIENFKGDESILKEAQLELETILKAESLANQNIIDSVDVMQDTVLQKESIDILQEYDTLIIGEGDKWDTLLIEKEVEDFEIPIIENDSSTTEDSLNQENIVLPNDTIQKGGNDEK